MGTQTFPQAGGVIELEVALGTCRVGAHPEHVGLVAGELLGVLLGQRHVRLAAQTLLERRVGGLVIDLADQLRVLVDAAVAVRIEGTVLPTLFDIKRRYADNSIKHGVISVILPEIQAKQDLVIDLIEHSEKSTG